MTANKGFQVFFFLDNLSIKQDNKSIVFDHLPIYHISHYQ